MPKPKIMTLLVIRKIARWPSSNGSRFSAYIPKYDENNAGKIIATRVSKTTERAQKKTTYEIFDECCKSLIYLIYRMTK